MLVVSPQISQNKGLTAKKKKELRNPRVKHRRKFYKAQIKRKSQVRSLRIFFFFFQFSTMSGMDFT